MEKAEVRKEGRDRSETRELVLVASNETCPFCAAGLFICEHRHRYVETLTGLVHVIAKGKRCSSSSCAHPEVRVRPSEEGRLVLKGHEFGLDVVMYAGEQYLRERLSIPRIHKLLRGQHDVPICERSVGNLIDDYVALCECVAGDTDRLRTRLREQGAMIIAVDGVQHDDRSPVLYVQREVLSGEVLYAERRLARATQDLVPMLARTRELARDIGVPIVGIVSDKERSLVPAVAEAYPGVPHQFCQQHYLGNLAKPLSQDDHQLAEAAREVVLGLREVQRSIEREETARGVRSEGAAVLSERAESPAGGDAPTSDPELKAATALAQAGVTVGVVSGRASLDPPGLKRIQRLEEVRAAAEEAARKKGVPRVAGR